LSIRIVRRLSADFCHFDALDERAASCTEAQADRRARLQRGMGLGKLKVVQIDVGGILDECAPL
jgi:hypothetical protein